MKKPLFWKKLRAPLTLSYLLLLLFLGEFQMERIADA